jgi:hypothetical protein
MHHCAVPPEDFSGGSDRHDIRVGERGVVANPHVLCLSSDFIK